MVTVLLFFSAVGTAAISAVVGMAGGVTLLSIMILFMPLNAAIPIHGIVQLVSNITLFIINDLGAKFLNGIDKNLTIFF